MPYKFIYYFTLIAVFSACRPQVVDITIPPAEPRLVVHANWKIQGNPWLWVWVGRTVSILSDSSLNNNNNPSPHEEDNYAATDWVENANVELYENGFLIATLVPNPTTHTYRFLFPIGQRLQANAKYELRISSQGYTAVTAAQENISIPAATIHSYQPNAARDINGEQLDVLQVNMPANNSNSPQYFDVVAKISPHDTSTGYNNTTYLFTQSPDPTLESAIGRIIYKAESNSPSQRITLHLPLVDSTAYRLDLEVRNISVDYFQFYKSLMAYYSANNNPFAEPVVLFSNIQNGRGLFSLSGRQDLNVTP